MTQPDTTTVQEFSFHGDLLQEIAKQYRDGYKTANPFPHVVIDDFVPPPVIDRLLAEFPSPQDEVEWQQLEHTNERKLALAADWRMGPFTRHLLAQFNSSTFVTFLEDLTAIQGLIPDPHFVGGGLHQIQPGGFLKVHADFNLHKRLHLDRRLNVLLYLNRDWQESYGGQLQLWDRHMNHCVESVLPVAGRCVVFSTTDYSFHGHPDALTCPPDRTRKSLALYYYTNGRPAEEISESHTTIFRARPDAKSDRAFLQPRTLARQVLPPILLDSTRSLRQRIQRRQGGRRSGQT